MAVQEAVDDFTVFGELGRQGDSLAALLAREHSNQRLVVLMVQTSTNSAGEVELSVDVKDELDARIPDGGSKCPACSATLRPWVRFCTRCGHDVTGKGATSDAEREELRSAVKEAVEADYEFLGDIRRSEGGGDVFFARERSSGRIAALRLNSSAVKGEFELGETNIMRKAPSVRPAPPSVVSVTQLLRKWEPESASPSALAAVSPSAPRRAPSAPAPVTPEPSRASWTLPHISPGIVRTVAIALAVAAVLGILAYFALR